jgi:hypothetical protein
MLSFSRSKMLCLSGSHHRHHNIRFFSSLWDGAKLTNSSAANNSLNNNKTLAQLLNISNANSNPNNLPPSAKPPSPAGYSHLLEKLMKTKTSLNSNNSHSNSKIQLDAILNSSNNRQQTESLIKNLSNLGAHAASHLNSVPKFHPSKQRTAPAAAGPTAAIQQQQHNKVLREESEDAISVSFSSIVGSLGAKGANQQSRKGTAWVKRKIPVYPQQTINELAKSINCTVSQLKKKLDLIDYGRNSSASRLHICDCLGSYAAAGIIDAAAGDCAES